MCECAAERIFQVWTKKNAALCSAFDSLQGTAPGARRRGTTIATTPSGQPNGVRGDTLMNFRAKSRKWAIGPLAALSLFLAAGVSQGTAQTKQPNILVIMGDDI